MRIGMRATFRLGNMDAAQHLHGLVQRVAPRQPAMQCNRFADLAAHRHQRVERGHRLLEDHRNVIAADLLHLRFGEIQQIGALETDRAADGPSRRVGNEAQYGQRSDALAAAALADDAQSLAAAHRVGHPVDRAHNAAWCEEMRLKVIDLEHRVRRFRARPGLSLFGQLCLIQEVTPENCP